MILLPCYGVRSLAGLYLGVTEIGSDFRSASGRETTLSTAGAAWEGSLRARVSKGPSKGLQGRIR